MGALRLFAVLLPIGFAMFLVGSYVAPWATISLHNIGRSDFTNQYVGALLLRQGRGPSMYEMSLQTPLYWRLMGTHHTVVLQFMDTPLAALLAVPFTFLRLDVAYHAWSALQLVLITVAAVIAIRAAPRPWGGLRVQVAIGLSAVGGAGTLATFGLGQKDGLWALGLAIAYAALRRGRTGLTGAVLGAIALIAKPQLALGLLAFLIAWRDRRMLIGLVMSALFGVALWLLIAGPGSMIGFVGADVHSAEAWPATSLVSFGGVAGVLAGNTALAEWIGLGATAILILVSGWLGRRSRSRHELLEPALAAAVVLSVLAAPHAFPQDLALLTPAVAWTSCAAMATAQRRTLAWIGVLWLWTLINVAGYVYWPLNAQPPFGTLTPWTLLLAAVAALYVCQRISESLRLRVAVEPAPIEVAPPILVAHSVH